VVAYQEIVLNHCQVIFHQMFGPCFVNLTAVGWVTCEELIFHRMFGPCFVILTAVCWVTCEELILHRIFGLCFGPCFVDLTAVCWVTCEVMWLCRHAMQEVTDSFFAITNISHCHVRFGVTESTE